MMNRKLIRAIHKQLNNCMKHCNYHVLIMVSSREKKDTIYNHIKYWLELNKRFKKWSPSFYNTKHETIVRFWNGSSLRIARSGFKIAHIHSVIADINYYPKEILYRELYSVLVPYKHKRIRKILREQIY